MGIPVDGGHIPLLLPVFWAQPPLTILLGAKVAYAVYAIGFIWGLLVH